MRNASDAVRVLLVEDSVAQAKFIQQTLSDPSLPQPFDVDWVTSLADTLRHLAQATPALVLLDLVLPDSDGIDTFDAVHRARPEVPVIVLSGAGDEATALRAVAEGAQDYLAKSTVSPALLTRSIRYALERDRKLVELRRLALRDELTGLHNRRGFVLFGEQQLAAARRTSSPITTLFVDVDGLKRINDTYGHSAGDAALADVAALMRRTFRACDVLGRVGGDEFCVILLDDGTDSGATLTAAARFQAAIDAHNAARTRPFPLSCTVGAVTCTTSAGLTVADLLSKADSDLYERRRLRRVTAPGAGGDTRRPHRAEGNRA